jgi:hypothetical protein|tara:strand:- start:570 stop:971 length:402 start_codon:yes stop_codon:yes gene_type:complete
MEPYEHEIRLITMNQSPIKVDIPQNVTLYEIDMDSTNFDLGFFFDVEILSQNKPLFIGPVGNNHKSINILNWRSGIEEIVIKLVPNFLLSERITEWLITSMDLKITIHGYTIDAKVLFDEKNELDDEFKEDWI